MHFTGRIRHGAPMRASALPRHRSWDRAGTHAPKSLAAEIRRGMVDLANYKQWYDWTMKGGEKPEFLKQRVAYYVMGVEEWKYAESLEAIPTTVRSLYLGSDGRANDVFHSGTLSQAPAWRKRARSIHLRSARCASGGHGARRSQRLYR
jgi:hypothetical protein